MLTEEQIPISVTISSGRRWTLLSTIYLTTASRANVVSSSELHWPPHTIFSMHHRMECTIDVTVLHRHFSHSSIHLSRNPPDNTMGLQF